MSWPTLVKYGGGLAPLGLKLGFKGLIKNTIFKQFVGGENITDCGKTIEQLAKYNIGTILDYSVEGKESEVDFDACCKETIETVHRAKGDKNIPFCVFKVTGLASFELLEKVTAKKTKNKKKNKKKRKVKNKRKQK